jgi:hypothetical protein
LPCTIIGSKHAEHSCRTDHKCHNACEFCQLEAADTEGVWVQPCKEKAGHGGHHLCASRPHTCNQPCKLTGALNCRGTCSQPSGHEGDCDCGSGNHLCGVECALPGCSNQCVEPYGSKHTQHACQDKKCPQVSSLPQHVGSLAGLKGWAVLQLCLSLFLLILKEQRCRCQETHKITRLC